MIHSPLTRLMLLLAFVAHVFVGFGHAQGFAWCFSAAGDARLEKNFQADCDTSDPCADEHTTHADHGNDPEHCGDCLDLPALVSDLHQASRFSPDIDLPAPALIAPAAVRFAPSLPLPEEMAGLRPQPLPSTQTSLAILRTTVLRN